MDGNRTSKIDIGYICPIANQTKIVSVSSFLVT
nr:MAG TPA: hypothetical protein [Caudoviricetes sp.]